MNLNLVDDAGNLLAKLVLTNEQDGWYAGTVLAQTFPSDLREALHWYDEVLENQMLSYLDQATDAVERFGVHAQFPDGTKRKLWSLHITKQDEVFFRTSPVPASTQEIKIAPSVLPSPTTRDEHSPIT